MTEPLIRATTGDDFVVILGIINYAAQAYQGVIPEDRWPKDRWHDPYMSGEELQRQIDEGVRFSAFVKEGEILGVMGIQDRSEVELIRHAYVATGHQGQGIGEALLKALIATTQKPILIGTWKAAVWAIRFYERHGFSQVNDRVKDSLLRRYWNIPERQVETSVVLADQRFDPKA